MLLYVFRRLQSEMPGRYSQPVYASSVPPTADDCRIAARAMGFGTSARRMLSCSQASLRSARLSPFAEDGLLRPIKRLRLCPNASVPIGMPPGPTPQELSGCGGAKTWGLSEWARCTHVAVYIRSNETVTSLLHAAEE